MVCLIYMAATYQFGHYCIKLFLSTWYMLIFSFLFNILIKHYEQKRHGKPCGLVQELYQQRSTNRQLQLEINDLQEYLLEERQQFKAEMEMLQAELKNVKECRRAERRKIETDKKLYGELPSETSSLMRMTNLTRKHLLRELFKIPSPWINLNSLTFINVTFPYVSFVCICV